MAYDLFFLSHGEQNAEKHWFRLREMAPHAQRVEGIDGILLAHQRCAQLARTANFFVVDADNEVLDLDVRLRLPAYDQNYVHIWRAKNPVNGLVYGWGGIKLFPRKLLRDATVMPLDLTTSFTIKVVEDIGSITHFNTSAYDAWRSAFRECVKLTCIDNDESRARLAVWCSVARGAYAEDCLRGACDGRVFAMVHRNEVGRINDWDWLRARYAAQ